MLIHRAVLWYKLVLHDGTAQPYFSLTRYLFKTIHQQSMDMKSEQLLLHILGHLWFILGDYAQKSEVCMKYLLRNV